MRRRCKGEKIFLDPYISAKGIEYLGKFILSKADNKSLTNEIEFNELLLECFKVKELREIFQKSGINLKGELKKSSFDNPLNCIIGLEAQKIEILFDNLEDYLAEYPYNNTKNGMKNSEFYKKLVNLKEAFALSEIESEIIILMYTFRSFDEFRQIFDKYNNTSGILYLLKIFNPSRISDMPRAYGKLLKLGVIDNNEELEDYIIDYFVGISDEPIEAKFYKMCEQETLPIFFFDSFSEHMSILEKLFANKKDNEGLKILLYGIPGAGKTEFARSLARHFNYSFFEINNDCDERERYISKNHLTFRFSALKICQNRANPKSSIILIDEADEMLNGSGGFFFMERNTSKNIINNILDETKHICIWITNTYQYIDYSTKRRFNYSIEFKKLTSSAKSRIWENTLSMHGIQNVLSLDDIKYLADKYETNAGNINIAVGNFKKIGVNSGLTPPVKSIENIIKSHLKIMDIKTNPVYSNSKYSLDGLNIKGEMPISDIIFTVKNFIKLTGTEESNRIRNMNILLYGPSGTGKTEFAKYLSRELHRELMIMRASDLLDMYVGGTEKRIRHAFREAEGEEKILFIDEFDGLISSRENAVRSWEVTQVNEILIQMEDFKGILICATNFKTRIDSAAIRRFNFKVEFDYLNDEGKNLFFDLLLKDLTGADICSVDEKRLSGIKGLTPGDYKVVSQKYAFMPKDKLNNSMLISSLDEEVAHKNYPYYGRTIGFS